MTNVSTQNPSIDMTLERARYLFSQERLKLEKFPEKKAERIATARRNLATAFPELTRRELEKRLEPLRVRESKKENLIEAKLQSLFLLWDEVSLNYLRKKVPKTDWWLLATNIPQNRDEDLIGFMSQAKAYYLNHKDKEGE